MSLESSKMQEKARGIVKYYGTTTVDEKMPLILKTFFFVKFGFNGKSMSWGDISHEDRLMAVMRSMGTIR